MFGINQSKNQVSSAATTNTTDSNNSEATGSYNQDKSRNAGGNVNEYNQTDKIDSDGGAVNIGEQGLGAKLIESLTSMLRPQVAQDHTYEAGVPDSANLGTVSHTTLYVGVALILVVVGGIIYFGTRK